MFSGQSKEVVRIKVKKCDGLIQPEYRKLCVDPQLTSFETLQNLLARAFNVRGMFSISYLARDDYGGEVYLSLLSDWDLDAAFLSVTHEPFLRLKMDLKPFEEGLEDWDVVAPIEYNFQQRGMRMFGNSVLDHKLLGTITSQVGRTMSQVSKAMGLKQEDSNRYEPSKLPMTDAEFHNLMDPVGHLIQPQLFRLTVYQGGVEPALRKVVWRHLLNVYPENMSGRERFEYLKRMSNRYYKLKEEWRLRKDTDEVKCIMNMVKKDVLRTDRHHGYFEGADDNKNVVALFNLLVTYAVTHPDIAYCQGMSDIASPILVVQNDEAHSYICFCCLMKRLRANFTMEGEMITLKFQHLSLFLQHQDPVYYNYLKEHNADDMFFCYRWLLLEMKREFPLDDAMHMLEVMWSSLLPDPPQGDIELCDSIYKELGLKAFSLASPSFSSSVYVQLMSKRKKPSPAEKSVEKDDDSESRNGPTITSSESDQAMNHKDFETLEDVVTTKLQKKADFIDKSLEISAGDLKLSPSPTEETECLEHHQTLDHHNNSSIASPISRTTCDLKDLNLSENPTASQRPSSPTQQKPPSTVQPVPRPKEISVQKAYHRTESEDDCMDSASLKPPHKSVSGDLNSCEEATEHPSIDFIKVADKIPPLPPPMEFGGGNPFLMCLCLALLLQHRDRIILNQMDHNELAMLFDKMVRKHNVYKVVHQAKALYSSYLKLQQSSNV